MKLTTDQKNLIRRYLIWFYKTVKEDVDRIDRKFTQVIVDKWIIGHVEKVHTDDAAYQKMVSSFKDYVSIKMIDGQKQKFLEGSSTLNAEYKYRVERLKAVEQAIKHFLGVKELTAIRELYEEEMTRRILMAREER